MYRGVLLSAPPWLVYYEPTNVYYLLVYYYFIANHRHKRLNRLFVWSLHNQGLRCSVDHNLDLYLLYTTTAFPLRYGAYAYRYGPSLLYVIRWSGILQ